MKNAYQQGKMVNTYSNLILSYTKIFVHEHKMLSGTKFFDEQQSPQQTQTTI